MSTSAESEKGSFDKFYPKVDVYPPRSGAIAITDRIHPKAIELAGSLGLDPIDLINEKFPDAIRQLQHMRFAAILGRGSLDTHFENNQSPDAFYNLRQQGVMAISRLGNGVTMRTQDAFDEGLIVERTPGGNAKAVRVWQDLMLLLMTHPDQQFASTCNPVATDNRLIKQEDSTAKLKWRLSTVHDAVNPTELDYGSDSQDSVEGSGREPVEQSAEFFRGKKVAVIGPGRIGMEVIRKSPFLQGANIYAYDVVSGRTEDGVTMTTDMDEALADADMVLIHIDGKKEIIGARELALMKRGAMICNVARGQNINPKDLWEAIQSGHISKAGLDTHFVEGDDLNAFKDPPASGEWELGHYAYALRKHNSVIAGNHSAASEEEAEGINAEDGVRAIHSYLTRGEIIDGVVTPNTRFPMAGV